MPQDNPSPRGIYKTRDLVELYYGRRMVVDLLNQTKTPLGGVYTEVLGLDSRRIRYEMVISNGSPAADVAFLYDITERGGSAYERFDVPPHSSIVVERDWLTDFDGVTNRLVAYVSGGNLTFGFRITVLVPAPIDESS